MSALREHTIGLEEAARDPAQATANGARLARQTLSPQRTAPTAPIFGGPFRTTRRIAMRTSARRSTDRGHRGADPRLA